MKTSFAISAVFLILIQTFVVHCLDKAATTTDDEETNDICKDGTCSCDDIQPYLISCVGNTLDKSYDDDEWMHTIEKNKLTNRTLNFNANKNRIKKISKFPSLSIVTLSFKHNKISEIDPYAFSELTQLDFLDLSYNELTSSSLPEEVFEGNMDDTSYKSIPLRHLNLSNNLIHSIEKDVFDHLPKLLTLDLSNNPLKVLGSTAFALASLKNLEVLRMANAELKQIPDSLMHDMISLESLDLSGNNFVEVPAEILNSHHLRILILDNNLFESLDKDSFFELTSLTHLSISHIPTLKVIESFTFATLLNLTVLECHHNRYLSRISNDAFDKVVEKDEDWQLRDIQLNDNALSHIDREFAAWHMIQNVDIQNNPFRCDCDLQWMTEVLVPQIERTTPHLTANIKCGEPENLKGSDIVVLSLEDKRFSKCKPGESSRALTGYDPAPVDSYQAAGITILIIGVILTTIGLAILGVIIIKRRAIAAALIAHHEIRYQRADTYDEDNSYRSPASGSVYKVVV